MFGQRKSIFVKEQVSLLKLRDTYDLHCPETGDLIGQAKDEPATWAKWLRLLVKKAYLPTTINVYAQGEMRPSLQIHKRAGFFRTRLFIWDGNGTPMVQMRSKFFSLGGAFFILDPQGNDIGTLQGDWKGWDYQATLQGQPIGKVTKKWAGLVKEGFTTADQYLVLADRPEQLSLMLGLALSVDVVFKEKQ